MRDTQRERERGRDTGRGRSRLHAGSPTQDSIPGPQGHTLGRRQALNCWATQGSPVSFLLCISDLPVIPLSFFIFLRFYLLGSPSGPVVWCRLGPGGWSWRPGIESHVGLPAWSLLLPLPVSLPLSVSLMNKQIKSLKKKKTHTEFPSGANHWTTDMEIGCCTEMR